MSKPITCSECKKRNFCRIICEAIEKLLPKISSGRLSGEHSFDPNILEKIAAKRAFGLRFGSSYERKIDKENKNEKYFRA